MLDRYIAPGDGVIDIGANVGEYTRRYAELVGPSGKVLAVEPGSQALAILRNRTERYPQVTTMQVVVGATFSGDVRVYHDTECARNSVYHANLMQATGGYEDRRMVPLDFLAEMVPNLTAIKVDAQGSEMEILKGAPDTLKRNLVWLVEIWKDGLAAAGSSVRELCEAFAAAGYQPSDRNMNDCIGHAESNQGHQSDDIVFVKR